MVRGRRKAKVSKLPTQITQQLSGLGNCFKRIEWVFKLAQSCRCGHKLGYALCTCRANRIRLKATFLPDQAGEKIRRQIMARCRLRENLTKANWCGRRRAKFLLLILFRFVAFGRSLLLRCGRPVGEGHFQSRWADCCHGWRQEEREEESASSGDAAWR